MPFTLFLIIMTIKKRDGSIEEFDFNKVKRAIEKAFMSVGQTPDDAFLDDLNFLKDKMESEQDLSVESIQNSVELFLMQSGYYNVAKSYIIYREKHKNIRDWANQKIKFIEKYKQSDNTANATIDDNSNVSNRNIAVLNAEIHKSDNQIVNYKILENKLKELYPEFDYKKMMIDFNSICYLHDSSSQIGMPYCVAISLYPFLLHGLEQIGGLSAAPKNIDSFCGMFVNLVFAIAGQYKGAVAVPGIWLAVDSFLRKEWGDNYYQKPDAIISSDHCLRKNTIKHQIHQYFQQICYTLMQPSGGRNAQAVFWNCSIFDKPFFDTMYSDFVFPDGTKPQWESLNWLQKEFLHWLNQERLKCILTFPVVSVCLLYQNGEFLDKELAEFVAKEYSEGNSFFTYISDSADSLSSCCFSKDQKVLWKSSTTGVHLTTFEELHNTKWEPDKKNLRIFHNGSWVSGRSIKLPNRKMYKVVTCNNKEFFMTDNHINVTLNGEIATDKLTTDDYLLFNTMPLNRVPENDENLSYAEGVLLGAYLGDGSISNIVCNDGSIHVMDYSLNELKYNSLAKYFDCIKEKYNLKYSLMAQYNNVYPVKVNSKEFIAFIQRWTNWRPHTTAVDKDLNLNVLTQSLEFRKGILDGWYITDGGNSNRCYTTSEKLKDAMEVLIASLGMQSIINVSDRTDEKVVIRGEEWNRNYPLYCVRWYTPTNHRSCKDINKSWIKRNNSIYFRIKSIEEVQYTDDVYCVECKNSEEPYFTLPCGLITHNCRLSSKIEKPQFNFTNGQLSEMTGSKNVITLNLSRIIQDWAREVDGENTKEKLFDNQKSLKDYIISILDRVYKYQTAYNECLTDLLNSRMLSVYDAGFINMKKQYLTIGINALNQAWEFFGGKCNKNEDYKNFCNFIFTTIKEQNAAHKTPNLMFNTEFTPQSRVVSKPLLIDSKLLAKDNEGQAISKVVMCSLRD